MAALEWNFDLNLGVATLRWNFYVNPGEAACEALGTMYSLDKNKKIEAGIDMRRTAREQRAAAGPKRERKENYMTARVPALAGDSCELERCSVTSKKILSYCYIPHLLLNRI
jgi:hypothetical protein